MIIDGNDVRTDFLLGWLEAHDFIPEDESADSYLGFRRGRVSVTTGMPYEETHVALTQSAEMNDIVDWSATFSAGTPLTVITSVITCALAGIVA